VAFEWNEALTWVFDTLVHCDPVYVIFKGQDCRVKFSIRG